MDKISLYIGKKIFISFLIVLIVTTLLLMLLQSFKLLDLVINRGFSFVILLKFIIVTTPKVWVEVLPFTLLISAIFTWNNLIASQEITIIQGSGKNLLQIATPPIFIAVVVSIVCGFFALYVVPKAFISYLNLRGAISSSYNLKLIEPGKFVNINDSIAFYVRKITANNLQTIIISKRDPKNNDSIVYAENGYVNIKNNEVVLLLEKVNIIKNDSIQGTTFLKLDKYIFSLDTTQKEHGPPLISNKSATLFQLIRYKTLPIMKSLQNNIKSYQELAKDFHKELLKGIMALLLPFLFAVITAFFFTLTQYKRTNNFKHIVNSLIFCTLLKIFSVILINISILGTTVFIIVVLLIAALLIYKIAHPPSLKRLTRSIFF
ncbi:LptF/LptG family permease [Candidatus Hepatincola sp. Av]